MIDKMNRRERLMLGAVVSLLVVVASIFMVNAFIANRAEFRDRLSATKAKIDLLKKRESERDLWAKRDAWLTQNLPKLGDADVANKALRESVLNIARQHSVILEAPAPGIPSQQPNRTSLSIRLEAKGTWADMFEFLRELQGPDRFIAFEGCELKVNREDKTLFSASLNVAQWSAPK